MSVLAIINSDPEIKKLVEEAFQRAPYHHADLLFLKEEDEILEFLNYALPELVVINFSDPEIDIQKIVSHIKNDKWILNLGIVGIFSDGKDQEVELLKRYKALNVLTQLDNSRLKIQLVKSIEIIKQNFQIIFQLEFTQNLIEGASGTFIIDNDLMTAPLYSSIGATILSQRGLINPDNKMHLQLALSELLVNAIEHGNCGISYEEKAEALAKGHFASDIIAERCLNPAIRAKKVTFSWEIKQDNSIFTIQDEGQGFDVKAHIEMLKTQSEFSLHGRGIRMAAGFSFKLKYNKKGNKAILIVPHDHPEDEVPVGFSQEQVIHVKKGEIVLNEGEVSDYLYYISSGSYEVLHKGKPVGSLSPQDIFMGEMSFLLNQRRSATIRATSPGRLILLTQKNFINVIRNYPHYGIFLSKLLAKRLARSNERSASK